ncbi:MAG: DUF1292 domain-containing protein [Clostridiales bacterium]|nr:DUF1292 domain-containing protein [Clostridiales bacterium]
MAERENEMMEELEEEIIELVDENGDVVKFKLIDVVEYKGVKYVLLLAAEENADVAEDEIAIFILNEKQETLDIIEDDALLEEVYEYYCNTASEDDN